MLVDSIWLLRTIDVKFCCLPVVDYEKENRALNTSKYTIEVIDVIEVDECMMGMADSCEYL